MSKVRSKPLILSLSLSLSLTLPLPLTLALALTWGMQMAPRRVTPTPDATPIPSNSANPSRPNLGDAADGTKARYGGGDK